MKNTNKRGGKKLNRRMEDKAEYRADKRFRGGKIILKLLSRGAAIDSGSNGMFALQQKYGV